MAITVVSAVITLKSASPYSQSRRHDEPKLEGEGPADYGNRTWRSFQLVGPNGTVCIDASAMHQALVAGAKYSKRKIPGQGQATWTQKFSSGIALLDDIDLGIDPNSTNYIDIFANADGVRGSGKRVMRRYPIIPEWKTTFTVHILDPIITEPVFMEMLEITGMFIGVGRFRPEKGGRNGRFVVENLQWMDDRVSETQTRRKAA